MKWVYLLSALLVLTFIFLFYNHHQKRRDDHEMTGGSFDYTNPNAPKVIQSKDITSFTYEFPVHIINTACKRNIPYDYCRFNLERGDHELVLKASGSGLSGFYFNFEITLPLSVLHDLQVIVDQYEIVKVNGIDRGGIGTPMDDATMLYIKYASDERIYASDNLGHFMGCEKSEAIYDFFLEIAKLVDDDLMYRDEEVKVIDNFLYGTFVSENHPQTLVFQKSSRGYFDIYEDDKQIEHTRFFINGNKLYSNPLKEPFNHYEYFFIQDKKLFGVTKDNQTIQFTQSLD